MSIHSSLRGVNTLVGDRSVWTRIERIQALKKKGVFKADGSSVYGLPKVRTKVKVARRKQAPAAAAPAQPEASTEGDKAQS